MSESVSLEESVLVKEHSPFKLSVADLTVLYQRKDTEKLVELGGIEGLAKALQSDLKVGLSRTEIETRFADRKSVYGINVYPEKPRTSWFALFWEALQDTTLIILIVAAVVSLILGIFVPHKGEEESGWIEGAAILFAVIIVSTVTATNNYTKEGQFRNLKKASDDKKIKVIRDSEEIIVSIFDINVGDIVVLETGDLVAADGVYISGYDLKIDESVLTGEPDAIRKSEEAPWISSGSQVSEGVGRMIVIGVGINSEWGRTLNLINNAGKKKTDEEGKEEEVEEDEETPLQKKLGEMAKNIGKGGTAVAAVVFFVLLLYWAVRMGTRDQPWEWSELRSLVDFFIIAVTIVVVAVPEGLPLAVTISLAYSMNKMHEDKNLVKHLAASETMGGATNICSDKTGTLTENRMSVREGWIAGTVVTKENRDSLKFKPKVFKILTEGIAVNSTANIHKPKDKPVEYVGNKTECALLAFIQELGCEYKIVRKDIEKYKFFPFNSARKRMTSVVHNSGNKYTVYCKGASEIVLDKCTSILDEDGNVSLLTTDMKNQLRERIETMADQALRTLCLAYKEIEVDEEDEMNWGAPPENNLVCVAIVGIMDPLRKDVPEAVAQCRRAGIFVRMVTGDNITTAKRIAQECGILTDGVAIEGPDFAKLSGEELDDLLPRLQVLARSSPTDKYTLVNRLKHNGEVVAATGDGTNDAPALKVSDVGLAMGIAGTEIAKEASDIVILDDNFASIVKTVMWGRSVYDNIRKFLQFQLTVNVVALTVAAVGAITDRGTPLKAIQLLWVNLIMDTMAALALGTERPTMQLLERKPYGRNTPLISYIMWRNLLGQAVFQVVVLFTILYTGHLIWDVGNEGSREHYTMLFNTFVFCQVFNEINSRKVNEEFNIFENLFANWMFSAVIAVTVVLQILIVEFGGKTTATSSLSVGEWLSCIGIALISFPLGAVIRAIPVPKSKLDREADKAASSSSFSSGLLEESVEMD